MTDKIREWLEKARDFLQYRRIAYLKIFTGPYADIVLKDLAKFCRSFEPTYHADPRTHALLEGRREVWLRIQHHLQLSEDELWKRYGQPNPENK